MLDTFAHLNRRQADPIYVLRRLQVRHRFGNGAVDRFPARDVPLWPLSPFPWDRVGGGTTKISAADFDEHARELKEAIRGAGAGAVMQLRINYSKTQLACSTTNALKSNAECPGWQPLSNRLTPAKLARMLLGTLLADVEPEDIDLRRLLEKEDYVELMSHAAHVKAHHAAYMKEYVPRWEEREALGDGDDEDDEELLADGVGQMSTKAFFRRMGVRAASRRWRKYELGTRAHEEAKE